MRNLLSILDISVKSRMTTGKDGWPFSSRYFLRQTMDMPQWASILCLLTSSDGELSPPEAVSSILTKLGL